VAMLSVQNVFYRPRDKQAVADQKKSKFNSPEGDHVTLLEVYKAWSRNRFSAPWCYENFIQVRSLRKAQDVRKQLIGIMDRYRLEINSCGQDYNRLRQAIAAGYFNNLCRRDPNEGYRVMRDLQQVYIHPSSALYQKNPEWVIYYELVMTTREYIREVCTVEPEWMPKIAPNMFKQADSRGISRMKANEKIEPLYSKYHDRDALRTLARR
ncbi:ATP-dependent RNA helicase dhx8, partial [Perkinsus olseni]